MVNNEINAIREKICATVMPRRVYLFGSFAKDAAEGHRRIHLRKL